ncbi:MAG: 16S rRNA (guanine(527)-N(7))-methyltransferase RsmG [Ruminococcus sp.]|nr:16S rRNA (guanine(527)-N(7))-methyltransferase RsmG [Ruminococcus sp.]
MLDLKLLRSLFDGAEISVGEDELSKFETYAKLLVEWNEKINLTAITAPDEICEKHFFDSVMPFYMWGGLKNGAEIIDVGTGAGFPSCPLKIVRSDLSLTLLDSLNKRINFLNTLSESIGLDAECVHGRAEEFGNNADFREKFDIATARAVANLRDLCEYCVPFVKVGGYFVALKGQSGLQEVDEAKNAIRILGGKVEKTFEYTLPNGDGRVLVIIKKVSTTPAKYPRNKGQMKKKPL